MTLAQCLPYFVTPRLLFFGLARQFVDSFVYRDDDLHDSRVPLSGNSSALTILYLVWPAEKGFLTPRSHRLGAEPTLFGLT